MDFYPYCRTMFGVSSRVLQKAECSWCAHPTRDLRLTQSWSADLTVGCSWRREEILEGQTGTGLPSKRRYESWLSTGRQGVDGEQNKEMKKSLQPNTHSYNQNHTITVFVKYTRNALQITRLSQTNKSNALTCIESTNQHSPGDSINKPNRTGTTPVKYNAKDWACGGGEASSKLNPNITSPRRLDFFQYTKFVSPGITLLRIFTIIGLTRYWPGTDQVLITNFK